ncbi:MAG: DUF502 domain-containing protein [Chromatiales bacterium]|nr:DUF502 domain-containing protein [Chromatiales bacterium]
MIKVFEDLVIRVPVVQTIYGSTKKLIQSLQQEPTQIQRVVLIEFPSPGMKAVGFVTHVLRDEDSGRGTGGGLRADHTESDLGLSGNHAAG